MKPHLRYFQSSNHSHWFSSVAPANPNPTKESEEINAAARTWIGESNFFVSSLESGVVSPTHFFEGFRMDIKKSSRKKVHSKSLENGPQIIVWFFEYLSTSQLEIIPLPLFSRVRCEVFWTDTWLIDKAPKIWPGREIWWHAICATNKKTGLTLHWILVV